MSFKFSNTLKPHFGQIQDGRHPNNKISMSSVPVLELKFFCIAYDFSGEEWKMLSSLMIGLYDNHLEVTFEVP